MTTTHRPSGHLARLVARLLTVLLAACADETAPPTPAVVTAASGDGQVGQVRSPLPAPLVAKVLDLQGAPLSGVQVVWSAAEGHVEPIDPRTDAQGRTRARWVLGDRVGTVRAEVTVGDLAPATFTAVAEPVDPLPLGELRVLALTTYDGSGQVVHPDYAGAGFDHLQHLAITPYPFGDAHFENPSVFVAEGRPDQWSVEPGSRNPVVLPDAGYLSDPDLVWVPERAELWLYYRQVTSDNIVQVMRTRDGRTWAPPVEVVRAPNHQVISPSVVRRAEGDWWLFSVNAGAAGCGAATTTVEVRRSSDGVQWGTPAPTNLAVAGFWPWHLDVQWIPSEGAFWALFNGKTEGGCTTPAAFIARSEGGLEWVTVAQPVLVKGAIPPLQDIVYRGTFGYDPVADAVTFWFSGARYESGRYRWSAAVERRRRADVFTPAKTVADEIQLTPAPAPLDDWP